MQKVVSMKVPGEPRFIQVVKMAAGSAASLVGFDIESVDDIEICVAEAAKLITCHDRDTWCQTYEMNVKFSENEDELIIEISSEGNCGTICKQDNRPCLDCPNEGNLGMAVINSLMDNVEVKKADEGGNKSIVMIKKCNGV